MKLQQITFDKKIKEANPNYLMFVKDYKELKGATLLLVTSKGNSFIFEVTKTTYNQMQSNTEIFGGKTYIFADYCLRLEESKQARFYIVDIGNADESKALE